MSCEECKKTGLCQKKSGLPVFLTRYGIAPVPHLEKALGFYTGEKGVKETPDRYLVTEAEGKVKRPGQVATTTKRYKNISDSGAQAIHDPFMTPPAGKPRINLDSQIAIYTLRVVRSGYLYVFDENNDRWQAYFITRGGFYIPLPAPFKNPSSASQGPDPDKKPCQAQNFAQAGSITLPVNAGIVWFAYSDVEWTEDVFNRYQGKSSEAMAYRLKHMRRFDAKKWRDTGKHDHADKIDSLPERVADFSPKVNQDAFFFSPSADEKYAFPLIGRCQNKFYKVKSDLEDPDRYMISDRELRNKLGLDARGNPPDYLKYSKYKSTLILESKEREIFSAHRQIITAFKRVSDQGLILALDDPAGIAMELANLMDHLTEAYSSRKSYLRKAVASQNILALQKFVPEQIETRACLQAEKFNRWIVRRQERFPALQTPVCSGPQSVNPPKNLEPKPEDTDTLKSIKLDQDFVKALVKQENGQFVPITDEALAEFVENKKKVEWAKCAARYKEDARQSFEDESKALLEKYFNSIIIPLSEAHAKWLESELFTHYFEGNFSTIVPQHGNDYPLILGLCIGESQNKPPSAAVVSKWMRGKTTDKDNPFMRALVFNQDKLATIFEAHRDKLVALDSSLQKLPSGEDAQFTDKAKKAVDEWRDAWRKTIEDTEEIVFQVLPKQNAPDEDLIKMATSVNGESKVSAAIPGTPIFSGNTVAPAPKKFEKPPVHHTIVPSLDFFIGKVCGNGLGEITKENRDKAPSFYNALMIHERSHWVELEIVGTHLQHARLMNHELGLEQGTLEDALIEQIHDEEKAPEEILGKEVRIKTVSTVGVEEAISFYDSFTSSANVGSRRTEANLFLGVLKGVTTTTTEPFINGFSDLQFSRTTKDLSGFISRLSHALNLQKDVLKTERAWLKVIQTEINELNDLSRIGDAEARKFDQAGGKEIDKTLDLKEKARAEAARAKGKKTRYMSKRRRKIRVEKLLAQAGHHREIAAELFSTSKRFSDKAHSARIEALRLGVDLEGKRKAYGYKLGDYDAKHHTLEQAHQTRHNKLKMSARYAAIGFIVCAGTTALSFGGLNEAKLWGKQHEVYASIGAGSLYTFGMLAEAVAARMAVSESAGLASNYARGINPSQAKSLIRVGRLFAYVGLGIEVGLSAKGAVDAIRKDQYGLASLHAVSAIVNFAATRCAFAGPKGLLIAAVLFTASIALSYYIDHLKDSQIQDYLWKCAFGNNENGWPEEKERALFEAITAQT